ncbi:LOW QUALITY PROTEIN: uncharacterized protein ACR2FA_002351 [Aphomia sociella]
MDENIDNSVSVLAMLDNQSTAYKPNMDITFGNNHTVNHEETELNESSKQTIIWTKNATCMLLNLYETKINMLDNPKKKSKMWTSIAEELKSMNVEVTPDQVRWKINALTKKYKDCIDNGQGTSTFKYFNEMHQILGRYNNDGNAYRLASGMMHGDEDVNKEKHKRNHTLKSSAPFRKLRAERRAKLELDKQWIEYLRRQEEHRLERDERCERSLRLREEELQLKKRTRNQTINSFKEITVERKETRRNSNKRKMCFSWGHLIASFSLVKIHATTLLMTLNVDEIDISNLVAIGVKDDSYVENILDNKSHHNSLDLSTCDMNNSNDGIQNVNFNTESKVLNSSANESNEKQSAVWTTRSTATLLKLYESKLEMLETPKKKTRIWIAISESLKNYDIEMTPDQVRWKINALAKKYKQCIDSGQHKKFRYFKEMDSIYSRYNVDCDSYTISEILKKKSNGRRSASNEFERTTGVESKAMIELRKLRLASRIESDRMQTKLNIEKQWLEYLRQQEQHRLVKEDLFERNLKLREEELELRKRELELKEALEYKKMELAEKDVQEILQLQREKCELLERLFS